MLVHDKTKENESSENVTSTGTKSEATLLFHVIEQGMQSLLLRDKYFRILIKTMDELEGDCKIFDVELTWEGQDYLSAIEDDNIWNKTKGYAKEKGLEIAKISFEVVKNLAIEQSKKILGIE
ncbi:DUF2513 domain-containing protein [Lysinibacillus sphaericus]|uniref:DUF2513 domain-containing protein n=1 Tax=Lysinibacillus sphaericus TaxID=1421 RepID=UPI00248C08F7|nr:DUF2513 domain-containing protein [Lysinibacillus sphaericus]